MRNVNNRQILAVVIALALVASAVTIALADNAQALKIKKQRVTTPSGSNGGPNGENGGNGQSICGGTCTSNSNDIP